MSVSRKSTIYSIALKAGRFLFYLLYIFVLLCFFLTANECNTDQQCSQHHCITGYKAVCSTTSHQCSCQHTCSRASDCVRYNCPHGGDIMCSSVYGSTSTCACQNGCSSNGDCSTNICSTGSTSVCDGGHCKCKATCHSDSDCPIFVTCQAGTMPYCSPSNKHTCECVART